VKPLQPMTDEERRAALNRAKGLDAELVPLNATDAEREAAGERRKERSMDPQKPGWKTTEFWFKVLIACVVVPLLMFVRGEGPVPTPLPDMAETAGRVSSLLAFLAPLALKAIMAGVSWALIQLSAKYGAQRGAEKVARVEAAKEIALAKLVPNPG
jgi:hypothetical protein